MAAFKPEFTIAVRVRAPLLEAAERHEPSLRIFRAKIEERIRNLWKALPDGLPCQVWLECECGEGIGLKQMTELHYEPGDGMVTDFSFSENAQKHLLECSLVQSMPAARAAVRGILEEGYKKGT